jgi:hypothetical protein
MFWAPGSVWKVFQLTRACFEQFSAEPVTWGGPTTPGSQMCGRRSNCLVKAVELPGNGEHIFALCCIPVLHCCIGSGGVCFGSGGACICAGGALCGVRALDLWFVLFV